MPSEILLVNKRRTRRRSSHHRRGRRRMTAKQLMYFGKRRTRRRARRSGGRRHRAVAAPLRRHHRRRHSRRSFRRTIRRFRRATGGGISLRGMNFNSFLQQTLVPSAVGAVGALGVDLALGYAAPFLPAALQSTWGAPLTRIAAAVGLGVLAQTVTKDRRVGEQVMTGAIVVFAYGFLKSMVKAQFPTLPLSAYVSGLGDPAYGIPQPYNPNMFGYAGPALAFPDRLGLYVGQTARWDPSVSAAIQRATTSKVVQPGMHGIADEFSEGGYNY